MPIVLTQKEAFNANAKPVIGVTDLAAHAIRGSNTSIILSL